MRGDTLPTPVEAMAKEAYENVRHWLARRSGTALCPWDAEDDWLKEVFRRAQQAAVAKLGAVPPLS
jgi:hypothetical protein